VRDFRVALGDTIEQGGTDYGIFPVATPAEAVSEAVRDADPTRQYDAPELLSESLAFGRGRNTWDNSGQGTQDRSSWYYVTDDAGRFAGVFAVSEQER
jgi:hypothetical protein